MPKCTLKPLGNKVVIERSVAAETTKGGIVLPDTAKGKPKKGTIRSTGPGSLLDNGKRGKMQTKVGNEILFTSYAGTEVEVDGDTLIIMDESDILAIIE